MKKFKARSAGARRSAARERSRESALLRAQLPVAGGPRVGGASKLSVGGAAKLGGSAVKLGGGASCAASASKPAKQKLKDENAEAVSSSRAPQPGPV